MAASLLATTNQFGTNGPNTAPWDVLWVAVGLIAFVLVIALAATALNRRDDRRVAAESRRDR